jgi:hypothetical protein
MESLFAGLPSAGLASEPAGVGERGGSRCSTVRGGVIASSDGSGARLWNNLFKRSNMFSWHATLTPGSKVVDII